MNLYQASSNWATRPADQRFPTVQALHDAAVAFRERAAERMTPWANLHLHADGNEIRLTGPAGVPARLTHWAFGQLSARAGAPASFLRQLPASLAVDVLQHTLTPRMDGGESANLLLSRSNGDSSVSVHALLTDRYQRIWDDEITARLLRVEQQGWKVPPARPVSADQPGARLATEADCLTNSRNFALGIKPGDWIAPAGLYASDHDVFAFMVREDRAIDAGDGRFLNRGFFVWNSEVGAASFGMMTFLYDAVCGNHIVWGARDVKKVRVRHVGTAKDRVGAFVADLKMYADTSAAGDEARVQAARRYVLGKDKETVLDAILGKRIPVLSAGVLGQAYDMAERIGTAEGEPNTVWGMVNGLTRVSQQLGHADDRVALDRAAGKLLDLVF